MKIVFQVLVLLFAISFATSAQSDKRFRMGPHLGFGMAQISKLRSGEKAIFRPAFGWTMDIRTSPNVTFSTGLTHMTMGESSTTDSYSGKIKILDAYHTLMVPLTSKIHPKSGRFFGMIGVQPGFVYKNKFEVHGAPSYGSASYKKIDFGATAGVGYNLGQNLCLDLRYYHGITNIHKSSSMFITGLGSINIKKETFRQLSLTAYCFF